ncbi:MAG: hypothetical protein P8Y69_06185, partial [Gammaproteobacteria bacterium]
MPTPAETAAPHEQVPEFIVSVARRLAQTHAAATREPAHPRPPVPTLAFEAEFAAIYGRLSAMDVAELDQLPGTEWLLDNDYVIQRAVALVAANTPRDGYRRLPVFTSAARPDQLRALILADELIN